MCTFFPFFISSLDNWFGCIWLVIDLEAGTTSGVIGVQTDCMVCPLSQKLLLARDLKETAKYPYYNCPVTVNYKNILKFFSCSNRPHNLNYYPVPLKPSGSVVKNLRSSSEQTADEVLTALIKVLNFSNNF